MGLCALSRVCWKAQGSRLSEPTTKVQGLHVGELGLETMCRFLCPFPADIPFTNIQNKLAEDPRAHGAMFVPIILGSDKTTVSIATGQNDYYPLYVSVGNVHNNVRRAHNTSVMLLSFLSVPKG